MLSSGGETLAPAAKARIERAFGCTVRDAYNASEVIAMTLDCARGRFHVNADWYIVEPVDERYQPVPAGQPSHTVLVTNLANRVQPIIRYDLGDSVVLEPNACPCSSPFPVIRVEGRTDDILAFPAADGATVRVPPMALATVVEETPGVRRFQVIQTAPIELRVRLEVAESYQPDAVSAAVERRLATYLAGVGLAHVMIQRAAEPPRPNPRSSKFRHVWAAKPAGVPPARITSPA
jgi:phenylacetate-coenzyme A ligase PaaK-like adenylate-forming protein